MDRLRKGSLRQKRYRGKNSSSFELLKQLNEVLAECLHFPKVGVSTGGSRSQRVGNASSTFFHLIMRVRESMRPRTHPQGRSSDWGDDRSPPSRKQGPTRHRTSALGPGHSLAAGHSNCTVILACDCPQKNACSDSREPEAWLPFRSVAAVMLLVERARERLSRTS